MEVSAQTMLSRRSNETSTVRVSCIRPTYCGCEARTARRSWGGRILSGRAQCQSSVLRSRATLFDASLVIGGQFDVVLRILGNQDRDQSGDVTSALDNRMS